MTSLPENPWSTRTTDNILAEMLALVPATLDKSVGSFVYDTLSPVAAALSDAFLKANILRQVAFVDEATGAYLDARVEEHGLVRNPAIQAIGIERFTAVQGTTIPAGTQVSTVADPNSAKPPVVFFTNATKQVQPRAGTGTFQETDPSIVYTGVWSTDATTKYSNTLNDNAIIYFNGTQITVRLITGPTKGIVGYATDGGGESTHDLYAASPGTYDLVIGSLSAANHFVTLRVTHTKNASASDYLVNIDFFTIVGGAAVITDTVDSDITALNGGVDGNVGGGTITRLVSGINNVVGVTNPTATAGGSDLETDDALRTRFKIYVQNPPASGNIADYKRWALEADSRVGAADVLPLWSGNGTVKVFILDKSNNPAAVDIIAAVQAYIDPTATPAQGKGKAPIGATVTVVAPVTVPIDVNVTLTVASGFDVPTVQAAVKKNITAYLQSLGIADTIRFSGLANAVHDTSGVQDYSALQFRRDAVAFATTNIVLAAGEKAVADALVVS